MQVQAIAKAMMKAEAIFSEVVGLDFIVVICTRLKQLLQQNLLGLCLPM